MILNTAQAKAIQSAMVALNDVNTLLYARILQPSAIANHEYGSVIIHVKEYLTDEINVWHGDVHGNFANGGCMERFASQDAFFKAYEL